AVRLHSKPRTTTYAGSVVRFAARVLQMIGLAAHARAEQDRASRVAVLRDLLDTGTPDRTLLERLNVLGFRLHETVRIVVADVADPRRTDEALARLTAVCARGHVASLCHQDADGVIALMERSSAERTLLATLIDDGVLDTIGVGLDVSLSEGIQQTHREAQI